MIYIVSGRLGGGKTLSCVDMMARHVRNGGVVVSNIVLKRPAFDEYVGRRVEDWQVVHVDVETANPFEWPHGDLRGTGTRRVLLVIDEALEWLDNSDYRSPKLKAFKTWLRHSDKLGIDVFLIAQDFTQLTKSARNLAQRRLECLDWDRFKFPVLHCNPFPFLWGKCSIYEYEILSGYRLGMRYLRKSPKLFACYDTAAMFGVMVAGDNAYGDHAAAAPVRRSVWQSPVCWQLLVSGLLFLVAVVRRRGLV